MVIRLAIFLAILVPLGLPSRRPRLRPPEAPALDPYPAPRQLRRADSARPEAPWLVALLSAATSDACRGLPETVAVLACDDVATSEIELGVRGDLHTRYDLAAVPTTLVADTDGVVRRAFVGAFSATDLWAAVAELRRPGSTPEPGI